MARLFHVLFVAALAACTQQADPPAAPEAAAPQPNAAMSATFQGCEWGEVQAAGVSVWSFACPNDRLVGDEALPGFQREFTDAQGAVSRHAAIRLFAKAPDAPIEAVLDAVRATAPEAAGCAFETSPDGAVHLMPEGATRQAWEAFARGQSDGPSMPCGPLGPSEAGERTFQIVEGAPGWVAAIDWGSEIQIFDAHTLRASN